MPASDKNKNNSNIAKFIINSSGNSKEPANKLKQLLKLKKTYKSKKLSKSAKSPKNNSMGGSSFLIPRRNLIT